MIDKSEIIKAAKTLGLPLSTVEKDYFLGWVLMGIQMHPIHLYEDRHRLSDKTKFMESLSAKCEFKKIPIPTFECIERHPQKKILSSEWENMLRHQLPELKHFEYFWGQLEHVLLWCSAPS